MTRRKKLAIIGGGALLVAAIVALALIFMAERSALKPMIYPMDSKFSEEEWKSASRYSGASPASAPEIEEEVARPGKSDLANVQASITTGADQKDGDSGETVGSVTSSISVDDKHLYIRKEEARKPAELKAGSGAISLEAQESLPVAGSKQQPIAKEKAAYGKVELEQAKKRVREADGQIAANVAAQSASPKAAPPPPAEPAPGLQHPLNRLKVVNDKPFHDMFFKNYGVNPTIDTEEDSFSTFSVDVDTASYTMARSYLERGHLPEEDSIRVEEFINAFDYGYDAPAREAFSANTVAFPSPNRKGYHVLHIGLKGRVVEAENRKPANLVFVVDTSGSMNMENRLELVKKGLGHMVDQLKDGDTVGIVAYGSHAYEVLRPTSGRDKSVIFQSLNKLYSTGSTNAQAGIHLGYQMALQAFKRDGINRIILCSDGVANNGIATGADAIFNTVRDKAQKGITISAIGFGMANYNDVLMERLANQGDGNYFYVDRPEEARRVFVENLTGMLQVIAKDVKIQVEFDPAKAVRYRLLGYENRALAKEDFSNDKVDAGEIGSGHSVTAIYEVKLKDTHGDFGMLRIRHKRPEGGESTLIEQKLSSNIIRGSLEAAPPYARLALAAAAFAEKLRGSYWVRNIDYDQILALHAAAGQPFEGRKDVVELGDMILRAKGLDRRGDKFSAIVPVASMDFDSLPVVR